MSNTLFLLCPTDCLESVINDVYRYENFFYTSLGNSFTIDMQTIACIKEIIIKHHINKIYLVLSEDNKIIYDALGGQSFSKIRGLKPFYNEIRAQKKHSIISQQNDNPQFSFLSHYLNKKITELRPQLYDVLNTPISIRGRVYNRYERVFKNIYSSLICLEKHCMN